MTDVVGIGQLTLCHAPFMRLKDLQPKAFSRTESWTQAFETMSEIAITARTMVFGNR